MFSSVLLPSYVNLIWNYIFGKITVQVPLVSVCISAGLVYIAIILLMSIPMTVILYGFFPQNWKLMDRYNRIMLKPLQQNES